MLLNISLNLQENTRVGVSFFFFFKKKTLVTSLKKTFRHRCFLVNFTKFLRVLFFMENIRWLFLKSLSQNTFARIAGKYWLVKVNIIPLHKKWSFPLRISSVNLNKSAGNCKFAHIYWRNPLCKTSLFVQCTIPNLK